MSESPKTTSPVTAAAVAAVVSSIATATLVAPPNLLQQITGAYNSEPAMVIVSPAPELLRQEMMTHQDYSGEHGLLPDAGRP